MRHLVSIALGMVGACVGLPALAATTVATVQVIQGQVSINRGEGFQPAAGTAEAHNGDSVMVSPGGKGRIVYSSGCAVEVYPGVVTVREGSCKASEPMMVGPACDPSTDDKCLAPPARLHGTPWYIYPAAAALIVGVTCIGWCRQDDEHRIVRKERDDEDQGKSP